MIYATPVAIEARTFVRILRAVKLLSLKSADPMSRNHSRKLPRPGWEDVAQSHHDPSAGLLRPAPTTS